jgi:hypothetical protein
MTGHRERERGEFGYKGNQVRHHNEIIISLMGRDCLFSELYLSFSMG